MIRPFTIHIEQEVLDDMIRRIQQTRWLDTIVNSGWNYGADLTYMKELAGYWQTTFDWRKTEMLINSYGNYIAKLNGYDVHFMHIKGKGKKSIPLIITHGWPPSFIEMMKLIPLLTENKELSFDLVIPSMMGFGFSEKITQPGCNVFFMADFWFMLMTELGYSTFGLQGGDFGAGVSSALALKYPKHVLGLHLNYIPGNYQPVLAKNEKFTEEEILYFKSENDWYLKEGGYSHQQKTKPLTLAYGLNDSPVALCAWIFEKMHGWSNCKGQIESVFTKDELLSNVTLYWVTETIHSSVRLYNENSKSPLKLGKYSLIDIPVGIARFKFEEPFPPRKFIERGFNITHWSNFPEGGHFPAIEQPELLAEDIYRFFKSIG
ncbi:MAG: epoxide hydrolase [Chitinophagaceae bacterium]|jgi:pimeloyl-ACP methyl ester carboxylesterase|nr:epoxide hydrolase [Chitinophagaceae bacterium]